MKQFALALSLLLPTFIQAIDQLTGDIAENLLLNNVTTVDFTFFDLEGTARTITLPTSQVSGALQNDLSFDGSSIRGYSDITNSDMIIKALPETLTILPWGADGERSARILCSVCTLDGTPYEGDPRNILVQAMDEAHDMGFEFQVGTEMEFFLIEKNGSAISPIDNQQYCEHEHDIYGQAFARALLGLLTEQGVIAEKWHHEVAPGQFEFSIKYTNALSLADQICHAKQLIRSFAQAHNVAVTFMPKPFFGQNGNGMHINCSLYDVKNNGNAFYDPQNPDGLSKIGEQFSAGVLKYIKECTALINSTINSYKRLVPGYEAPTLIALGQHNRSALIRKPHTRGVGEATRIEIRCADPACNPYLALAIILKAGLAGIKENLPSPEMIEDNLFEMSPAQRLERNIDSLPASLQESINLLKQSDFARTALGNTLLENFVAAKERDLKNFQIAVTDWELNRYL